MIKLHPRTGDGRLAARLKREIEGEVLFDAYSRGRYSTDASIYQIEPVGVVIPKTERDAQIALQIALEEGVRCCRAGAAPRNAARPLAHALVIDHSKHLNQIVAFDRDARTVCVQPGVVLDQLNAWLKPHGLWYPVDVSTSAQATLGGMAGNNSCGSRSIRYGNMVHNVRAIDAVLADGSEFEFGAVPADVSQFDAPRGYLDLIKKNPRYRRARSRGNRAPLSQGAAARRRLQPRHGERRRPQHGAFAGRLGRHAGVFEAHPSQSVAAAEAQDARRVPFPDVFTARWKRRSTSSS